MSTPRPIPETPSVSSSMGLSPSPSPQGDIFIPRRSRTISQSERAAAGPTFTGVIASFSRDRGHGFITPHEGAGSLFVHISDIDSEFVPQAGDEVEFKKWQIPPKNLKECALQVKIVRHVDGAERVRWDEPLRDATAFSDQ